MSVGASYLGMQLAVDPADGENLAYFQHCARGELRLQSCRACHLLRYPPTTACPWCATRESEWRAMSGLGTVYSLTEVRHAIQPGLKAHLPYVVLLVELDEQRDRPSEGEALRVIGNLVDDDGQLRGQAGERECHIGSRVALTFTQASPTLWLPQWRLVAA